MRLDAHLSAHKNHINKQEAARLLKLLALDRPASLFAGVAVAPLGHNQIFPIEPLFHPVHTKNRKRPLEGHFGFYHPGKRGLKDWAEGTLLLTT